MMEPRSRVVERDLMSCLSEAVDRELLLSDVLDGGAPDAKGALARSCWVRSAAGSPETPIDCAAAPEQCMYMRHTLKTTDV